MAIIYWMPNFLPPKAYRQVWLPMNHPMSFYIKDFAAILIVKDCYYIIASHISVCNVYLTLAAFIELQLATQ